MAVRSSRRVFAIALGLVCILGGLASSPAQAQQCNQRFVTLAEADVYRDVPQYIAGVGWRGVRIAHLTATTQLLLCERRSVPFGVATSSWARVAFRPPDAPGAFAYGWISQDQIGPWSGPHALRGTWQFPALMSEAFAQQTPAAAGASAARDASNEPPSGSGWLLPASLSAPAPGDASASTSETPTTTVGSLRDQIFPIWPVFAALLGGIAAKVLFDWLDGTAADSIKTRARQLLSGVVVSPIVFLGLLNTGHFDGSQQALMVLSLLAFQSGFFWQSVLAATGSRGSRNETGPPRSASSKTPLAPGHSRDAEGA